MHSSGSGVAGKAPLRPSNPWVATTEEEMQARMEQMSRLRDKQAAQLRAVLTEEQYARFTTQREEHDMRMRQRHQAPEPQ